MESDSIQITEARRQLDVMFRTAMSQLDMGHATAWELVVALADAGDAMKESNLFSGQAIQLFRDLETGRGGSR